MSMMDRVLETPDQLRWGIEIEVPEAPAATDVILLGMGGSGMAARIGKLVADGAGVPTHVHQGYGLPGWVAGRKPLVLAVSYSGTTEETLSGVERAVDLELPLAVVAAGGRLREVAADRGAPHVEVPDGMMPRAALGYQAAAVLRLLHAAAAVPDPRPALDEAADVASELLGAGDGAGASLGADLAEGIDGKLAIIYGGQGPGSLAASRWKAQINENAKMPAYANEIPELNHNEIEGWGTLRDLGGRSVALVALRDPQGPARVLRRTDLTLEILADRVAIAGTVIAQGTSVLARLFSLIAVGDVASVALAHRAGVDPTPIPVLEDFKRRLKESRP
jgi:glucose/mannose-6-phosphate isomerase